MGSPKEGVELEEEDEIDANDQKKKVDVINALHGNLLVRCAC